MHKAIGVDKLHANDWNPNHLAPEFQRKLEHGMKRLMDSTGKIPPIVVRPSAKQKGDYEIIDGYHRWLLAKTRLKLKTIDAFILDVDDTTARILTSTLNYIRGEADPQRYSTLLADILMKADGKLSVEELAQLVPENKEAIQEALEYADVDFDALDAVLDKSRRKSDGTGNDSPDKWVNLNFFVPMEVAGIVEKELDRISSVLTGKQRTVRALEYMAINSALTPLDSVTQQVAAKEASKAKAAKEKADASRIDQLKEKAKAKLKGKRS